MKVMLAGPIKAWWDEWGSERHQEYTAWREMLSVSLVQAGHLVYRPHEAWKGPWDESAQAVNDSAIEVVDVVINLTPPGVPSDGTDVELLFCKRIGKPVIPCPPGNINDFGRLLVALRVLAAHV